MLHVYEYVHTRSYTVYTLASQTWYEVQMRHFFSVCRHCCLLFLLSSSHLVLLADRRHYRVCFVPTFCNQYSCYAVHQLCSWLVYLFFGLEFVYLLIDYNIPSMQKRLL